MTVVLEFLLASVAVTAFGLVDEPFAGKKIVAGVALVTLRFNALDDERGIRQHSMRAVGPR
jgi:hypothetical protein